MKKNKSNNLSNNKTSNKTSNKSLNIHYVKNNDSNSQRKGESFKNYVDKSKLFLGYEQKRKNDLDSFENELDFSEESEDSNSNSYSNSDSFESSNFKFSNSIHENKKDHSPILNIGRKDYFTNYRNTESLKKIASKKSNCFTFKNSNEMKFSSSPSKKKLQSNIKSKQSKFTVHYSDIAKNSDLKFGQDEKDNKIIKDSDENIIKAFTFDIFSLK